MGFIASVDVGKFGCYVRWRVVCSLMVEVRCRLKGWGV